MGIPGSGIGSGTNSSSIQLTPHEQETTATANLAKAAMGIVRDSLQISFFQLDKEKLQYKSSSSSPNLPPLLISRGTTGLAPPDDSSWKAIYNELPNLMPKEFRDYYEANMQLPPDQRNDNITALDQVMQGVAKLLGPLRSISNTPIDPESLQGMRATINISQPYIALNSLALNSNAILQSGEEYLKLIGPNNPAFDRIAANLSEFMPISEKLNSATILLSDKNTEAEGRAMLSDLNNEITGLAARQDRLNGDGQLQMLSHILHSSAVVTAALSLDKPGASSMLIGLNNASLGLDKGTSTLGLTGPGFAGFSNAIADGLSTLLLKGSSAGQGDIFKSLTTMTMVSALVLGSLAYDGVKNNNQGDSTQKVSENNFSYDLKLGLLTESNALTTIAGLISKETSKESEVANEASVKASIEKQSSLAALLETAILIALTAPAIRGNDFASQEPILAGISGRLKELLTVGINTLNKGDDEVSQNMKVYLQQMAVALENNDTELLPEAVGNGIQELSGSNISQYVDDVKDLKQDAHNIADTVSLASNITDTTGFNIAA